MNVRDIKEKYEGHYADIEFYTFLGKDKHIHTDTIVSFDAEVKDFMEADDYELMDEADYDSSVLANSCVSANFEDWYGDEDANVLVIVLKPGQENAVYHLHNVFPSENDYKWLIEESKKCDNYIDFETEVEKYKIIGLDSSQIKAVYSYTHEIKESRILLGMSQTELSESINVPKRTLQNWESGTNLPPEYVFEMVISKMHMIKGFNGQKMIYLLDEYEFLENSIRSWLGNTEPLFAQMYEKSEGNMKEFAKLLVQSKDKEVTKTRAYAVASKKINPDGRHWYRVREMMGDKRRKVYSDAGSIKVGNENFTIMIPTENGDGDSRYAVLDSTDYFNEEMVDYVTSMEGENINIYSYDCGNEVEETISGRYSIYRYCGLVFFIKRNN